MVCLISLGFVKFLAFRQLAREAIVMLLLGHRKFAHMYIFSALVMYAKSMQKCY